MRTVLLTILGMQGGEHTEDRHAQACPESRAADFLQMAGRRLVASMRLTHGVCQGRAKSLLWAVGHLTHIALRSTSSLGEPEDATGVAPTVDSST